MNELLINGKDAFQEWGLRMGDDFISNILSPVALKEFIENESALEDGKRVILASPKLADRDVSLAFTIEGINEVDYINKYKSFVNELQKGQVLINVPILGGEIYRLTYLKSTSFSLNKSRTFSRLVVKFNEPNPSQEGRINDNGK